MTSQHPGDDGVSDEEAARRRDEVVKRMLATPPQPRAPKSESPKKGREPKPAPKAD